MHNESVKSESTILYTITITVFLYCLLPAMSIADESVSAIEAITQPSADIELSFVQAGKIIAIEVTEGDSVKTGDLLARQIQINSAIFRIEVKT